MMGTAGPVWYLRGGTHWNTAVYTSRNMDVWCLEMEFFEIRLGGGGIIDSLDPYAYCSRLLRRICGVPSTLPSVVFPRELAPSRSLYIPPPSEKLATNRQ